MGEDPVHIGRDTKRRECLVHHFIGVGIIGELVTVILE